MKELVLTVGLPRSGKSTWAKDQGVPVVCPDSIRLAIHGCTFIASAEPLVWATAHVMVSSLFLAGHDKVILDACNNTQKRREEWRSKGCYDWDRSFKVFDEGARECISRAKLSGREDLIETIERMDAQSDWRAGFIGHLSHDGRPCTV